MTFADIALKNVKKKFSSYLIYFVSTVISVVIFNLFCGVYYNPVFSDYRFGTGKMSVLFRTSAIAVFLFAAVFVMYSGSYFIKTQKKEIAIYSLLGMRKKQIAVMMFFETFFIGMFAAVCGIIIGTLCSGYFTSLLMNFMAIGTKAAFGVQPQAIFITLAAFLLLFVVSGFMAYRTIYKYSLIELLSASKQSEGVPSFSVFGAVFSLILLAAGYTVSAVMSVDVGGMHLLLPCFAVAVCVFAGTFELFRNFVPMAVCALKKKKSFYYKTSNFISISQIAFRLKANSNILSVISLLTAVTITMISASCSFYSVLSGDATRSYAPFSYLAKDISSEDHDRIYDTVREIGEVSVTGDMKIKLVKVSVQNDRYAVKDQQTGEADVGEKTDGYVISQSMYLDIIKATHTPFGHFSETRSDFKGGLDDNSCYFIDGNAVSDYCKDLVGDSMNVTFGDDTQAYTVKGTGLHKYIGALDLYKSPTAVVSDGIYNKYISQADSTDIVTYYGFQFDNDMRSENTVDAVNEFIPSRFNIGGLPGNISYIGIYKSNFALFGSYAFIGFFLGALFLLASGSIIYYKLIMEAQEEAPRYEILRKSGMKKKEILACVAKQQGLVFGIPLSAGLVHTLFGLLFYNRALGEIGNQTPTFLNAVLVALIFTAVYGLFYLLSVRSCFSIVWKRADGGRK